ncbi:MAG TPA: hypothetical protein VIK81_02105 [Patescibacteria group bacterium]
MALEFIQPQKDRKYTSHTLSKQVQQGLEGSSLNETQTFHISCERAVINGLIWIRSNIEEENWKDQNIELTESARKHTQTCRGKFCREVAFKFNDSYVNSLKSETFDKQLDHLRKAFIDLENRVQSAILENNFCQVNRI